MLKGRRTNPPIARALIVAARESSQAHLSLAVRQIGGQQIPTQGGVLILDYSADLGGDGLEVEVLGIPYLLYEQLFLRGLEESSINP